MKKPKSQPLLTEKEARVFFICTALVSTILSLIVGSIYIITEKIAFTLYHSFIPILISISILILLPLVFRPTTTGRRIIEGILFGMFLVSLIALKELLSFSSDAMSMVLIGAAIGAVSEMIAAVIRDPNK